MPMRRAAVAWAAASSGLSAGNGRVWLTASTLVTRPPSTRIARRQRGDGVTGEEGNRPHVLFDQVLRVTSGDERQEQDQVDLGGELQRGPGEQRHRKAGRRLPDRPRD